MHNGAQSLFRSQQEISFLKTKTAIYLIFATMVISHVAMGSTVYEKAI